MLKRFEVRNYKTFNGAVGINFDDICGYKYNSDCLIEDMLGKILIYGRNATGKTNFGGAISDIVNTLFINGHREALINADTDSDEIIYSYLFVFDNDEIRYEYVRSEDDRLVLETLFLNGRLVYKVDMQHSVMLEENLDILNEGPIIYERYFKAIQESQVEAEDIPFLRWIASNIALSNATHLASLVDYVNRMQFISVQNHYYRESILARRFYPLLENKVELSKFEKFLNYMGVPCQLVLRKLPDGQHELYFSHRNLVPFFATASSGTKALVELYRRVLVNEKEPSFLYLDEFDAFYHHEMSERLLKYLIDNYRNTQIILTTHNTNLMSNRFLRPDCLFILSGDGRLTSLPHATSRELREGHNLEKMYISGEFRYYE